MTDGHKRTHGLGTYRASIASRGKNSSWSGNRLVLRPKFGNTAIELSGADMRKSRFVAQLKLFKIVLNGYSSIISIYLAGCSWACDDCNLEMKVHDLWRYVNVTEGRIAFSALTLLIRHQEEHPACKNWVMRCWCGYLSGARCRLFAYGPADATAIPKTDHLLSHLNPDWF